MMAAGRWYALSYLLWRYAKAPTQEDLDHDSVCIVCRSEMDVKTALKLPCGHCMHTECIGQWTAKRPVCPICGIDLNKQLFRVADRQEAFGAHRPQKEAVVDLGPVQQTVEIAEG
jgi:hypothetical protein